MSEYIQVSTSVDDKLKAQDIAAILVERHLAACVQIVGPIHSVYRWQGKVESSVEFLCHVKTRQELYDNVEAAIREQHPYDEPEIVGTEIIAGSDSYLQWINQETTDAQV